MDQKFDPLTDDSLDLDQSMDSSIRDFHTLPVNPEFVDYVMFFPCTLAKYFSRLTRTFGLYFVLSVVAVYGVNQGIGEGWGFFAMRYLLSDTESTMHKGLGLSSDRMQVVSGVGNIPWQLKSMYGVLSDTLPISGLHLSPYIGIAGFSGVFSTLSFAFSPGLGIAIVTILLIMFNYSIASPDVMIDASVAKRCRERPKYAADLQTLCWGSLGIGQIFAGCSSGILYEWFGSRVLLGLCVIPALAVLVPAWRRWLPEERDKPPYRKCSNIQPLKDAINNGKQGVMIKMALFVCAISLTMGGFASIVSDNSVICIFSILIAVVVCYVIHYYESKINPVLAQVTIYIFLQGAMQPYSEVIYYWSKETPENCNGVYGERNIFFVIGTALYNRYFSSWPYRKIFAMTQLALVFVNLMYVLKNEFNCFFFLGISDKAFMLGEEVISPLISRFNTMPVFILAAKLCPPKMEATLFAMTMGLSNFGSVIGGYVGVGLLEVFGGVRAPEFHNIELLVLTRSLTRLLPILLIPYLVPLGRPSDSLESSDKMPNSEILYTDDVHVRLHGNMDEPQCDMDDDGTELTTINL
eukprot:GSMAST32.ASY1.ANO1.2681.1 assembled CDS